MSQVEQSKAAGAQGADVWGLLVEFETTDALMAAARKVRDRGFRRWDCHTPFPVHGLDACMGIKPTVLPLLVFFFGLTGVLVAWAMQWWMNGVDYQYIISNKPNDTLPGESMFRMLPAFVPIMFELMVLFSAFGAVFTMFGMNGLPRFHHPVFHSSRFARATCDRYFISVEAADPQFKLAETEGFLASLGGGSVERLAREPASTVVDEALKSKGLS